MEYIFKDEMRLELINENQIKCAITRNILQERNMRISELADSTEKAIKLFNDIMQRAETFLHFYAEDIPLMIEAVPLNENTIILIITKNENFEPPINE